MFAIVEIAGLQYKVEQDQKLFVNRLSGEKGDKVTFDKVLLTVNGATTVGAPAVSGIAVEAEIIEHLKADKVIVFKKKRRKGYAKKNGHRQSLTQIKIVSITGFDGAKKSSAKTETKATAKKSSKKGDDLTLIEGIGPKVAELFAGAGITSFADLAKKTKEELEAILDPNGAVYAAMDPTTWPQQAQLAADGKFEELEALKGQLKGGKA
ncbi:50S ribosomal protein L21 [Riemerella anatipestifer]|uniref:Large ribosomal subunit protein bL21 n=1 Tax=Riemerella anatipestifer (strain ATCC 11845 / DSM 15868 / JCM 9532 / NCTC 11014) TaxID=693978 RepID=E4TAF4_RIEAD|nr:50S ribosomal protein L21 [Riemerella anatipestifer]ADQ82314.1 LSU ribosomal protein L21P [Riemerella anatipestifer ATCC 11845 = DSM 15868]AFD56316.1 LSU ribosomal protein l21p [Riemerella anatipestifer ATCC 11845 = DSM 15868]MBT0550972.1 50S ribosomal protein L21 [Riemerella anatipestifer]MBT0553126.1 50S ribosomal protein L21 [Riemerella anatipestifer]MCE3023819.1 50S ribosomal protein L21 [Riemerella anatipestifer]